MKNTAKLVLPSQFQPDEKVGLQSLINLLQSARDGSVVSVSFTDSKVKYNLAVPIIINGEQHGFFRLANVDSAFLHEPIKNDFLYNDQVAIAARRHGEDIGYRNENSKVFDASWEKGTVTPEDTGDEMSDEFLVDVSGNREHFVIGWYDHGLKSWQCDANLGYNLDSKKIMYQSLPLAKYDK